MIIKTHKTHYISDRNTELTYCFKLNPGWKRLLFFPKKSSTIEIDGDYIILSFPDWLYEKNKDKFDNVYFEIINKNDNN